MVLNFCYHKNFLDNNIPDKSVKLLIADPPYFEVKGSFDFIWETFEAYLDEVRKWALECKRILADNGTIIWYGQSKKIAYTQIILDEYFTLLNNAVWDKGSFMGLEKSDGLKSLAPCTERVLIYSSKEMDKTGLRSVEKEYVAPLNPFGIELRKARAAKGVSVADVAEYGHFYGKVNHGGAVTNWERGYTIPSADQWDTLCQYLPIEEPRWGLLHEQYKAIRESFADKRRYFNNEFCLQEVLRFSNEQTTTGRRHDHDTVKPEGMTRALIITFSKPGDIVCIPFSGSGTEASQCAKEGRPFYAFDLEKKHADATNERVKPYLISPKLL